jgi:hypothetical protein
LWNVACKQKGTVCRTQTLDRPDRGPRQSGQQADGHRQPAQGGTGDDVPHSESGYGIEDTHRELTNSGTQDPGSDPDIHDVRRTRHVRTSGPHPADSAVLRENMKNAKRTSPGEGFEAHHIVPVGEDQAENVRLILLDKDIDINEEANGVYLSRGGAGNPTGSYKHEFTFQYHPEYFTLLNGLIKRKDSAETIRKKLRILGGFLEDGRLPTYIEVMNKLDPF